MHKHFRKLHRFFALLAAIIVAQLTLTGILLNHTDTLGLDEQFVQQDWLLDWYRVEIPDLTGIPTGENWLVHDGKRLFHNHTMLGACSKLLGLASHQGLTVAACPQKLFLLTPDGELVETLEPALGLPTPLEAIETIGGSLYLLADNQAWQANLDSLSFRTVNGLKPDVQALKTPPASIRQAIQSAYPAHSIHIERVLLDLHSGRLFGPMGVLFVDIGALLLLFMAFSGLWIWLHRYR